MFLPRSFTFVFAAPPWDAGCTKTPAPFSGTRSGVRFFRNPPPRPRRDDDPPPDDGDKRDVYNPLSEREQKAYLILAGIGCLPFLLLLLLAIITHSPFMAN